MKSIFLFIIFCLCANTYAQNDYKPGYVIHLNGEKEEGLINFKDSKFNAKKCSFKKDENADRIDYLPFEIIAYRFNDSKYFESKSVTIEKDSINLFLECLISGMSTIYYTSWKSKEYYFIEIADEIYEINNNEENKDINGVLYRRKSNQYKSVLKYLLRDCPSVVTKLDNAEFSKKSLIKLSKEYHDYVCDDKQCIIY